MTTRWLAPPPVHDCLMKVSKPHSPLEETQVGSGLGPFGCPEPSFWSWGTSTARKRRPSVDVLNGIEKRDRHFSVKGVFWILSFPSVDLKVAVS